MIRAIINRLKKNEKGFTLIELMVVVAIIGILAAGIIPQFMKATEKSRNAAAKADLSNFVTVLEIIYAEEGKYPSGSNGFTEMKSQEYIKNATVEHPWSDGNDYYLYEGGSGNSYDITLANKPGIGASSTNGITGLD